MSRLVFCLILILGISGCVNSYKEFYTENQTASAGGFIIPHKGPSPATIRYSSGDILEDDKNMWREGYFRIGQSGFVGSVEDPENAIKQASKIGAGIILISSSYQSTSHGSIPVTTTTPKTTYHSGSVNLYGRNASSFGSYSGSSTTYQTSTTNIPYSVDNYEQSAFYYAKLIPSCMGYLIGKITTAERQKIGTNSGVKVIAVRKNSPIEKAEIVDGDIILKINDQKAMPDSRPPVSSNEKIEIEIFRSGKIIRKSLITGRCE